MEKKKRIVSNLVRQVLIIFGTLFLGLGILGIFLPVLPTTPFLLITAACYAKSSESLSNWLLNNRWFGKIIKSYLKEKGIQLKTKILAISFLWITIGYSVFILQIFLVRILLISVAIGVTIHILSMRTLK